MSKQIKARPMNRERPSAHEVLLAGIGAVSLIRRNAGRTWTEATAMAGRLPETTSLLIDSAGERTVATIAEIGARGNAFRWEFERLVREFGKQASVVTTNVIADVEQRVQPVLKKLADSRIGLGIVVVKPKAKRAPAKKTARKAAKPVAKRTVRKALKAA
jgi:hypothetical protein